MKWFWYASPQTFYPLAGRIARWSALGAAGLAACGLYIGFFVAPTDAQQGEAYRIIFIHVPAAWMSMLLYLAMAYWAALGRRPADLPDGALATCSMPMLRVLAPLA